MKLINISSYLGKIETIKNDMLSFIPTQKVFEKNVILKTNHLVLTEILVFINY